MTTAPLPKTSGLEVRVTGDHDLGVRAFTVDEGISSLFRVELRLVSPDPDIDLDAVVGRPASFSLRDDRRAQPLRTWVGICKSIRQVDVEDAAIGLSTYEMTLVPELWLLTQRRNHRIFQQTSEPEVVLTMLQEWGLDVETQLDLTAYPSREYRVQYAESDFAFLSRMLEDAGIAYFFKGGRLVLSDAPASRKPSVTLPYVQRPTATEHELVTNLRLVRRVRPGRYTQRDIDYRRPPTFPVVVSQAAGLDPEARLERFHYNPGAFLFQRDEPAQTPVADDRGSHRADLVRGEEQVQRRLDAKRGSARVVEATTRGHVLSPGEVLSIADHPRRDLSLEHPLLVVSATHRGKVDEDWTHRFEGRFTERPFRPPIRTPKPKVNGIESATVVGPDGEEIHVDELGRIRVHFHWDRQSARNEQSSCWVHVSHPWGGAGYGAVNLPRIGQEVIIDFLGGDPDRPIVVGRVYTATQQVPYALPANKTQSGLKSYSSPATGGYNELMFEDAAGRELVRMQAERDLSSLVKHDETAEVRNDRSRVVGRDDSLVVKRHQDLQVDGSRFTYVDGQEVRTTRGNLLQETIDGTTIHSSLQPFLIESETEIVLKVGSSMLRLLPTEAVLQGDRVYINPPDVPPRLAAIRRNLIRLYGDP